MNFDFSALLVFLTFSSGIIWLIDSLFFAKKRDAKNNREKGFLSLLAEYARSFFPVFFIVLVLRSFIVEPFKIPSGSMMPTLLIGDFILVNKFDYGIRLPVIHKKIINNKTPERGDIVVFRYPADMKTPFIKRVIGLPGDKISYHGKVVYVNNVAIKQQLNGIYIAYGAGMMMNGASLREEDLFGNQHDILVASDRPTKTLNTVVPEGHYFVLGDNRDNSKDSRYWGFVPDENLIGRAFMIWMNWDAGIAFDRIGTQLK